MGLLNVFFYKEKSVRVSISEALSCTGEGSRAAGGTLTERAPQGN